MFAQTSGLTPTDYGEDKPFQLPYSRSTPTFDWQNLNQSGAGQRTDDLALRIGVLYGYKADDTKVNKANKANKVYVIDLENDGLSSINPVT